MKRLLLHIAVRVHLALAIRATKRARLHIWKCQMARIRLDVLDAGGK